MRPRKRSKGWKVNVFDVRLSSVLTPALAEVKRLHAVKAEKQREEEAMRRQQELERFEAEQIRAKEQAARERQEQLDRMEKEEQQRKRTAEIEHQKLQAKIAEQQRIAEEPHTVINYICQEILRACVNEVEMRRKREEEERRKREEEEQGCVCM